MMASSSGRTTLLRRSLQASVKSRAFSVSSSRKVEWGFIGLGRMGYPMARNLQANLPGTDTIRMHDINETATKSFLEEVRSSSGGAAVRIVSTPREAAEDAETTITVLREPSHVKNVFSQILRPPLSSAGLESQRLFIDCSTIDPLSSREVANAVHATRQGRFVDAPMSGGVVGAKAGTLTFMLGAPESMVSRVQPILEMMGKRVLHCGGQGAGLSGKLANNYLLAINNIATAEAMNLGIKWGLEAKALANLINVSTGRCWPSESNNPVKGIVAGAPAERDYEGGFGVSLMKKDLLLAMVAAEEAGARLELADKAREVYEEVDKDGRFAGKDFSVVYKYIGGAE